MKFILFKATVKILFSCYLLLTSFETLALNKFSHQLVCQLSFNYLPIDKQREITKLLRVIPKDHKILINKYNKQRANSPLTFAKACTWADAIKKRPIYDKFKTWHYLNVPRKTQKISRTNITTNNIVSAIEIHKNQLSQQPIGWMKLQTLMFLGHWLGDIHQPLHISFSDDKGGNTVKIKNAGRCKNLHWYWDECLSKKQNLSFKQQLTLLQTLWKTLKHQNNSGTVSSNDIINWANESYQLVKLPSFQYCYDNGLECLPLKEKPILADDYADIHSTTFNRQLVKAAQRLNNVLMQANLK